MPGGKWLQSVFVSNPRPWRKLSSLDALLVTFPFLVPQGIFLHLAGTRLGQLNKLHAGWALEVREVVATEFNQFLSR